MKTSELEFIEVSNKISTTDKGTVGVKILVHCDHTLTEQEVSTINKSVEDISRSVLTQTYRISPICKQEAEQERDKILSVFEGRTINVKEIPNGYCSEFCCKHLPWFSINTGIGRIIIGVRKRVIEIKWSDVVIDPYKDNADSLFPNETVTKGDYYIHAWSWEDAKKYVDTIFKVVGNHYITPKK